VTIRLAAATAAVLVAAVAPAAAQAATVRTDRACYQPGELINVIGAGFVASKDPGVVVTQDGQTLGTRPTDAAGAFIGATEAPDIGSGEKPTVFTATDPDDLTLTAAATTKLTALAASGSLSGRPEKKKRLRVRGFTTDTYLYAHVRRGRKVRNFRLGKLKKPCGTLRVYKRFFPRNNVPSGTYKVQIDGKRKYSSSTRPALLKQVRIFTIFSVHRSVFDGGWAARPLG
jgi:hypothetical protein